jgi:ABC-type sugar transport system ATPase subunit
MSEYVLELLNIEKSFFKVKVLDNVSLKVRPGEVHALVGENGAGKSTLMKILMGIYRCDSGEIHMDGRPVVFSHPREAIRHGISMIHQELNPILDMEVSENIFLGRELTQVRAGGLSLVDRKKQRQQCTDLFDRLGIQLNPRHLMRNLSVAQQQLVEIVKAISISAKVVVMDEPTSAITDKEVQTLFEQIQKLRAASVAVIYISHKMDEIFRIADRITVLRDGQHIITESIANMDHDRLIHLMVGRQITEIYPKEQVQRGPVLMQVKDFSRSKHFQNISFDLHAGEILGIAGLVGAGRSELVESIFGIHPPTSGELSIRGKVVNLRHPSQSIRHKMALITEDRKFTGLNLKATVEHNISLVHLSSFSKLGVIDFNKEGAAAESKIEQMRIRVFSRKSMLSTLSGGNQQKVVLSKWLLTEPDIIILDEPTRGIDVGAKRDIYLLMGELAKAGKAILMISSEIPEIMGLSDRIIVLAAGRLTGELDRAEFTQENIMRLASKFETSDIEVVSND